MAIALIAASVFTVSAVSAQEYRGDRQQQAYGNAGYGQSQGGQEYGQPYEQEYGRHNDRQMNGNYSDERYSRSGRGDGYYGRNNRNNYNSGYNAACGNNWNGRDRRQYAYRNGRRPYGRTAQCGTVGGRRSDYRSGDYRY